MIACIALVEIGNDTYLALHSEKHGGFVLPGGKWEKGEKFSQTALRELKEETGAHRLEARLVFFGVDENEVPCYTFLCEETGHTCDWDYGDDNGEGDVCVVERSVLLNGPFGGYYEMMFDALDRMPRR